MAFILLAMLVTQVSAHSGRTDSAGGHWDRSNGTYHYHHGYPAHDHYDMDGDGVKDCPYEFKSKERNYADEASRLTPKSTSVATSPTTPRPTTPKTATPNKEAPSRAQKKDAGEPKWSDKTSENIGIIGIAIFIVGGLLVVVGIFALANGAPVTIFAIGIIIMLVAFAFSKIAAA